MGLESMCGQPRPTRAEASDVANAVLVMRRICQKAESALDHNSSYFSICRGVADSCDSLAAVESVCSSAVKAAMDTNAPLILALTETGHTARMLAKYRPEATILAVSANGSTIRQLLCVRGVISMETASFVGTDSVITKGLNYAL